MLRAPERFLNPMLIENQNEIFTPPPQDIAAEYNVTYDEAYHGASGYMHSTYAPFFWPLTSKTLDNVHGLWCC